MRVVGDTNVLLSGLMLRASLPGRIVSAFRAVLAALVAGQADVLATGDADLLALRDAYPIVTPAEFVARYFT